MLRGSLKRYLIACSDRAIPCVIIINAQHSLVTASRKDGSSSSDCRPWRGPDSIRAASAALIYRARQKKKKSHPVIVARELALSRSGRSSVVNFTTASEMSGTRGGAAAGRGAALICRDSRCPRDRPRLPDYSKFRRADYVASARCRARVTRGEAGRGGVRLLSPCGPRTGPRRWVSGCQVRRAVKRNYCEYAGERAKTRERERGRGSKGWNVVRFYVLVNGTGFASSLESRGGRSKAGRGRGGGRKKIEDPRELPIRLHRGAAAVKWFKRVLLSRFETRAEARF